MTEKEKIVDSLLSLVWEGINPELVKKNDNTSSKSVIRNDFQNAFINRIIGFLGELSFPSIVRNPSKVIPGGWFVPAKGDDPLQNSCYFTVASASSDGIFKVYKRLAQALPGMRKFLITPVAGDINYGSLDRAAFCYFEYSAADHVFHPISSDDFFNYWTEKESRTSGCPDMNKDGNAETWKYAKSLLLDNAISTDSLRMLLLNRHIFDKEISSKCWRGRPTDIDFIKINDNEDIVLIDVKDKYVSAGGALGANEDHLPFFLRMDTLLGTTSKYVVRLSKSREDRTLEGWYYIPMKAFVKGNTTAGNAGMNSTSAVKTKTQPLSAFKEIRYGRGSS